MDHCSRLRPTVPPRGGGQGRTEKGWSGRAECSRRRGRRVEFRQRVESKGHFSATLTGPLSRKRCGKKRDLRRRVESQNTAAKISKVLQHAYTIIKVLQNILCRCRGSVCFPCQESAMRNGPRRLAAQTEEESDRQQHNNRSPASNPCVCAARVPEVFSAGLRPPAVRTARPTGPADCASPLIRLSVCAGAALCSLQDSTAHTTTPPANRRWLN